ncbi:MAG: Xaa-Pro peptidase family protein [Candidatus Neomarinimicrobiota bacterium]
MKPISPTIQPITINERRQRIAKAQRLMAKNNIAAILLEPGAGLFYFTGIDWYRSERLLAAIIPAAGELAYVCPAFEKQRFRELLVLGDDVRTWEEHENPFEVTAGILSDCGGLGARFGIEETVRFFIIDKLRKAAPGTELVSADPVTIPCRAYKSMAEIALMQRANEITAEAFKFCIARLEAGQSQAEFAANYHAALQTIGVTGSIDVQFGASTAFPHGSRELTYLKEGDVVLMDGQCTVDGYWSDISRTIVFGEPTRRQREIWELEKAAQAAAFAAAKLGAPCEMVDAAARRVITAAGFGPGYRVPGLPHRTGHGIGLDIHEWYHIVQGNTTPLAPGMCFSNEPMIAIYGEFGVRLEDCMYMAEDGAHFFTQPSPALDKPFV